MLLFSFLFLGSSYLILSEEDLQEIDRTIKTTVESFGNFIKPKEKFYCSAPEQEDCIPCPEHAICDLEGRFTCVDGFVKSGETCVENQLVIQSAKTALIVSQFKLIIVNIGLGKMVNGNQRKL